MLSTEDRNITEPMDEIGPCDNAFIYEDLTQLSWVHATFVVLYVCMMTVSLLGNSFVIWAIWRRKGMRTVTNLYLVNLSVCDLLVSLFVMPLKLLEYTAPCRWEVFARESLCAFLSFILPVFVFASVLTLVVISLERYYAVVHPLKTKMVRMSKSRMHAIIVATWLLSGIIASPYLFCKSYPFSIKSDLGMVSRQICNDRFDDIDVMMYGEGSRGSGRFRRGFFMFLFSVMYLLSSSVIVYTCVRMAICLLRHTDVDLRRSTLGPRAKTGDRNKRKVVRMVIIVSIAFIACWTPFYLVSFVSQIQGHDSFLRKKNFLFVMLTTHFAGFINSCINPLICIIMCSRFRQTFWMCLRSICFCARGRRYENEAATTMVSEREASAGLSLRFSSLKTDRMRIEESPATVRRETAVVRPVRVTTTHQQASPPNEDPPPDQLASRDLWHLLLQHALSQFSLNGVLVKSMAPNHVVNVGDRSRRKCRCEVTDAAHSSQVQDDAVQAAPACSSASGSNSISNSFASATSHMESNNPSTPPPPRLVAGISASDILCKQSIAPPPPTMKQELALLEEKQQASLSSSGEVSRALLGDAASDLEADDADYRFELDEGLCARAVSNV